MPTFIIGPFAYRTKTEAQEAVRNVLHTAPLGVPLEGADRALIEGLIEKHPSAAEKIGSGIAAVTVAVIEHGHRGFWIHRTDGTSTDFSYRKALSRPSHANAVKAALRRAIAEQVLEFKNKTFENTDTVVCPITGNTIGPNQGHVDHVIPFSRLTDVFVRDGLKMDYDDIALLPSVDGQIGSRLEPRIEALWQQFHSIAAELRFIDPAANRRRGAA